MKLPLKKRLAKLLLMTTLKIKTLGNFNTAVPPRTFSLYRKFLSDSHFEGSLKGEDFALDINGKAAAK